MRISSKGLCLLALLSGCAAVEVRPEVSAFSKSVTRATEPMTADLAAGTAAEEAAAREAAISAGHEVYGPPIDCISAVALTPGTNLKDCSLTPLNPAPIAPGSAKAMLAYTEVLIAYAGALDTLATSDAPNRVGTAFGGLLTSVQGLVAVRPEFADTSKRLASVKAPLTTLGTRLAEAQRMRLIRKLVRDAGPGVDEILDRLIAFRDPDDGLTAAGEALNAAYGAMEDARRSGDRATYAAAVGRYEVVNADLRSRMIASDAGRLILIREAHVALVARLREPGDIESYVALIETLKALSDAFEQ